MKFIRAALVLFAILLLSIAVILPQWIFGRLWPSAARRLPSTFFRTVARIMNLKVLTRGEPLADRACLYVSNHVSWLDIIVLSCVTPMSFIAKKEVASWPLFGTLATVGRSIYVDRERRHDVGRSLGVMRERLNADEIVTLFPEGTSSDGNRVLPFRSALMAAAEVKVRELPVPVQPITVAYTGIHGIPLGRVRRPIFAWYGNINLASHVLGVALTGPFEATVMFHRPTHIGHFRNRKELARHCEETIRFGLAEALTGRVPLAVPAPRETG